MTGRLCRRVPFGCQMGVTKRSFGGICGYSLGKDMIALKNPPSLRMRRAWVRDVSMMGRSLLERVGWTDNHNIPLGSVQENTTASGARPGGSCETLTSKMLPSSTSPAEKPSTGFFDRSTMPWRECGVACTHTQADQRVCACVCVPLSCFFRSKVDC